MGVSRPQELLDLEKAACSQEILGADGKLQMKMLRMAPGLASRDSGQAERWPLALVPLSTCPHRVPPSGKSRVWDVPTGFTRLAAR